MLAHLIHWKGKRWMVIGLPLIIAVVLFTITDLFAVEDKFVGAYSITLASAIMLIIDNRAPQQENTLMWIKIRYWSVALLAAGITWLIEG